MQSFLKRGLLAAGLGLTGCTIIVCVPRSGCDRILDLPPTQSITAARVMPPIIVTDGGHSVGGGPSPPLDKVAGDTAPAGPDRSQSYQSARAMIEGAASYVGPGDLVLGATAFYGLRAYNAAYARPGTNKAIEVRRANDGSVSDIDINKRGLVDLDTLQTFCASTTCFVTKWYDQSGHGNDIMQISQAQQPRIVLNGFRRFPIVQFSYDRATYLSGSFEWVKGNNSWTGQVALLNVEPITWYEPIFDYGTTTDRESLFALVHDSSSYEFSNSVYGTALSSRMATGAPSALTFYSDGSSLGGYINGTAWSHPYSDSEITGDAFNLGGSPTQSGIWLTGGIGELALYPKALSTSQVNALEDSERRYYGF